MKIINIVLIDISESMEIEFRGSSDKRSKLSVAKEILTRQLQYFSGAEFCLIEFNDKTNSIFKGKYTLSEFEYLKNKIESLHSKGSTNIGKALLFSRDITGFNQYDLVNIIVITDGEDDDFNAVKAAEEITHGLQHVKISTILIEPKYGGLQLAKKISINGDVRSVSNSEEFEDEIKKSLKENIKHSIQYIGRRIQKIDQQKALLTKERNSFIQQLENYDGGIKGDELGIPVKFQFASTQDTSLTSKVLETRIIPFVRALELWQVIINEIRNTFEPVRIVYISKFSPVEVSVEGAAQAFEIFERILMPWKRNHAKQMASLEEQAKKLELSKIQIEIEQGKNLTEEQKITLENKRLENRRLEIQIEKDNLELTKEKIKLLKELVNDMMPNHPEEEKIAYIMKLLKPLDQLLALPEDIRLAKE